MIPLFIYASELPAARADQAHPFLEKAARDLVTMVHHADAGIFVVSGWRLGRRSLSFPAENGAHGGAVS